MSITLTQPTVGSTSWGPAVNTNFQVVQDNINALNSGCVRAWVNFAGSGGATITSSFNVSSVVRNGAGDYTITFATALPDANYVVSGMTRFANSGTGFTILSMYDQAPTTTTVRIQTRGTDGVFYDTLAVHILIISHT